MQKLKLLSLLQGVLCESILIEISIFFQTTYYI